MFETVEEIKAAVLDSEGDQEALRTRMSEHFDYAVGKEYTTAKGYEQYTSIAPQAFFEKITDGLNRAELKLQIKLAEDAKKKERRDASTAELFLFGALTDIDRNLVRRGEKPLREGLGYYINVRGWYTLKCVVYVKDGETYFDVQPWDPMHVTYDYGSFGLLWIANTRMGKKAAIQKEYGISISGKEGRIIDFWDTENNAVIVDNQFVKDPAPHNLVDIPVLHGAVGPMPSMTDKDHMPTLEYRGHSVFNSAIHTFEPRNKFISQLMDIHKKSIVGSIIHKSKGGQKRLAGDPHAEYMEIRLDSEGEEVSMLELPLVPEVTAALLGIMDTEQQQSMLPYPLAYGGTRDPLSGRALAQLADATRSVYSPRTGAASLCYTWMAEQLLGQFAAKGTKTDFKGYSPDGRYFSVTVEPKDVKKGWYVSVELRPKLPRDLESDIQTAVMATADNGAGPIMSMQTVLEDIVQIRDPDAEEDRKLIEKGNRLDPIVIRNMAAVFMERGDQEMAKAVLALGQPPPDAAGGGAAPPGATGQPPELPPEMIQAIAQVFMQAGQEDLGVAVLELLGVPIPAEAGANGAAPAPTAVR